MIDELERVRTFGADVPAPHDEAEQAARAALARAIRRDERVTAREGIAASRRPRRRVWLVWVTAAAATAIVVVIVSGVVGSGSAGGPQTASAAVFTKLAAVAKAQPSFAPGPGQYLYVDSVQSNASDAPEVGCTMYVPEHRQIWIGADGSGRLLENDGQATFPSARDRAACARAGLLGSAAPNTYDNWFAARCLSLGPVNLEDLPPDPVALRAMLDARHIEGGPHGPAEDFVQIGDLLRETDASPALRAAIYKVAATIPGVEVLGPARDHSGRLGIGLAYGHSGGRSELILDPRTSALLGELTTDSAGKLVGWAVYLRSRIVNGLPRRPPAPLRPACVNGGGRTVQEPDGSGVTTG
ncbi:MAG TPA: CU044_5270 family protein [Solirubrobacteraceae bacterium]|nr:CU044_5270 family protein [Solirubrobacteraceae bacterium]